MKIEISSDCVARMIQRHKLTAEEAWKIAEEEAVKSARSEWGAGAMYYRRHVYSGFTALTAMLVLEFFPTREAALSAEGVA